MSRKSGEMTVKSGVTVGIPVQTYTDTDGRIGRLNDILPGYDTKAIGSVWLKFIVRFVKGKEEEVAVEIPRKEVLRSTGQGW